MTAIPNHLGSRPNALRRLLASLAFGALLIPAASAKDEPAFQATDLSGKLHVPFADPNTRAAVLVFITTECPISNYFQPTLRRLEEDYAKKGVAFFLVHSDPDATLAAARAHARDYKITAPVILDSDQKIAQTCHAEWTPEAVVMLPNQVIAYRGRIDDTYVDYGKKRPRPSSQDLKDALDRVLAGEIPAKTVTTKAVGCPIYFPKEERAGKGKR